MAFSEKVKREIFLKAKGKCERCGNKLCFNHHKEGEKDAWEAHHKVSVAAGGKDNASNGEALCLDCHKKTRTYGKH